MEKLKATMAHPTSKKIARIITFLEAIQVELELVNGCIKVRDHEFAVSFDLCQEDNEPITSMPPLFDYKLTREKAINKYCHCRHCDSSLRTT
jgi:hypothetical protein